MFRNVDKSVAEIQKADKKLKETLSSLAGYAEKLEVTQDTDELRKQLTTAKIEWDQEKEKWDREKREVEHMIGLQKGRGEQELDLAKKAAEQERVAAVKEAELAVREGNLETEQKMIKEQIDALTNNLHTQINYLKEEVLSTVIKAIPNFNVDMVLDPHGSRDRAAERKALAKGHGDVIDQ